MSNQVSDPQKVTVKGRLSYAHIFKAHKNPKLPDAKPKFSVNVILDPTTEEGKKSIQAVKAAIKAAGIAQWKKWPLPKLVDENGEPHDVKRFCLIKGSKFLDEDGNVRPETKGMYVLKCSSAEDKPPLTVDADARTPLTSKDNKIYSGSYGNVGVRIYGTDAGGSPGVFAALNAVQFKKHGEPLGGGAPARAEDYFEAEESEDLGDDDI